MNHLFVRSFLAICCGMALCLGSNIVSAHEADVFPEVEHVELEQKDDEKLEAVFPEVEHVELEQKDNESSEALLTEALMESIGPNDNYYLQRLHTDSYYHLVAYSDSGDVVQLHDASKWSIQRSGRNKVIYWVQSDEIFIKPSIAWFSSYQYVLYNRTTNQAVQASLTSPPLPMGAATFRIVNIEPHQGLILLSDNTVWQVGSKSQFLNWQIGQRVLVGVNNKWRTAQFPQILINIDFSGESYSEAIFYGYPAGY